MVVEVALHDRPEPLPRLRHRFVPAPSELLLNLLQLPPQALGDRPALHGKVPLPVLPAEMREAQEVERFRLPFSSAFPVQFGIALFWRAEREGNGGGAKGVGGNRTPRLEAGEAVGCCMS
jgi:hypothetical protein